MYKFNLSISKTNSIVLLHSIVCFCYRYLGSGCSLKDLHYSYRIGQSTLSKVVRKVCENVWQIFKEECFPPFNTGRWLQISSDFERNANFPHCLGALDGKHVRIIKPTKSGSLYHNYKQFFSVVLFAVADSNYNFIYIDVGSFGREGDSTVFQNSSFYKQLMDESLQLPSDSPLTGTQNPNLPYVFVGDDAFGLSTHILRPYKGKVLSKTKRIFNYRLSRARRYIECSFGILSNKWRIFHRPINVNIDFAVEIVKTCCLLHNYVRQRDGYNFKQTLSITGFEETTNTNTDHALSRSGPLANAIRNGYANYFESEVGRVAWQDKFI